MTEFQSSLASILNNLGGSQDALGQAAEARKSFEQAGKISERLVHEHPQSPAFAGSLGMTLGNLAGMDLDEERFDEARETLQRAIVSERTALAANPDHPWYRHFLERQRAKMIRAAEGLGRGDEVVRARRELDDLRATDPWNAAVDLRLKAVLKGQAPKDDSERLTLANRAYHKALYAASARFLGESVARNTVRGNDPPAPNRYSAACSAALAGCGNGSDAPAEPERMKLRSQGTSGLKRSWTLGTDCSTSRRKIQREPT